MMLAFGQTKMRLSAQKKEWKKPLFFYWRRGQGIAVSRGRELSARMTGAKHPYCEPKQVQIDIPEQQKKMGKKPIFFCWRRGQDSNLRYVSVHNISNVAPSTTQTPLRNQPKQSVLSCLCIINKYD